MSSYYSGEDRDSPSGAGIAGAVRGVVMATVMGIGAVRGCAVHATLTEQLTPVDPSGEVQKVAGTNFTADGKDPNVIVLKGKANVPEKLSQGLNLIHLKCKDGDDHTYTYDLEGAAGEVLAGQPTNYAGSQDDVKISRANGETIRLINNCPGKTSMGANGTSTVFVEVDR